MKKEQFFLILSIIGILILLLMLSFQKPTIEGKISSIKITSSSTQISIENSNYKIILLNKTNAGKISIGSYAKIYGQLIKNQNETVIFVDKIITYGN